MLILGSKLPKSAKSGMKVRWIEVMCHRRELVALAAVKAFVSRNQVPDQIMRYKGIRHKMLNRVITNGQLPVGIDTIHRLVLMDHNIPKVSALLYQAISKRRFN